MLFMLLACAPDLVLDEAGLETSEAVALYLTNPQSDDNTAMEDALITRIEQARDQIDVAIYDFDATQPAHALVDAAERGVDVRVVTDGDELDAEGILILEEAGIHVTARPAGDRIMHHKFAVIDARWVWTGSTNWTTSGFTMNNNNALFIDSPMLASQYEEEMEQLVGGAFGSDKQPSTIDNQAHLGRRAWARAFFAPQDDPAAELIEAIEHAEDTIAFMVFSFTREDVVDALIDAHERGVNVIGIFDESQARMWYSVDEDLAAAGIPVYIDGNDNTSGFSGGKLHHKVMLIDPNKHALVVTGSMNWSTSGNDANDENLLLIRERGLTERYRQEFCAQLSIASVHPDAPEGVMSCQPPTLDTPNHPGNRDDTTESIDEDATPDDAVDAEEPTTDAGAIRINEFLADPDGTDRGQEYIEFVNTGDEDINIDGWTVTDGQGTVRHTFSGMLPAGEAVVLFDQGEHSAVPHAISSTTTYLSLNNDGDTITLYDDDGEVMDQVVYEDTDTGISWNRALDGVAGTTGDTWVLHNTLSMLPISPGTFADGYPF